MTWDTSRMVRPTVTLAAVAVLAGGLGWWWAGPPPDGTAIVPPPCPSAYAAPGGANAGAAAPTGEQIGAADRLVPVGPTSVRICAYRAGSPSALQDVVLDPAKTSDLAALLDAGVLDAVVSDPWSSDPGPSVVAPDGPPWCRPGDSPVLLMFRYAHASPLRVAVTGDSCARVSTGVRDETGRLDVNARIAELLSAG